MPNRIVVTGFMALACAGAQAQPKTVTVDDGAIHCLTEVLSEARNAISVKPAEEMVRIQPGYKSPSYRFVARGVDYTFRRSDEAPQTIGVYLWPETHVECPKFDDPNVVCTAPGLIIAVPNNNGHYELMLRPPFPGSWYPRALEVHDRPNETRYVRQDSKDHPLYELWSKLDARCRIDNLEVNSGVVP